MKKFFKITTAVALSMSYVSAAAAECTNDTWNRIMERGKLVVGVKADYKPWGFRDSDGSLIGMEPDMAKDVADTLGVELELVSVLSSNRMQFLEQGKIDLMIATMSDREDRRKIVGIVTPDYYSSGTNLLAPKALGFKEWSELKGKPVCGVQGSFYNKIVEERYDAKIVAFADTAQNLQALRDKKCVGFVYDDSSIVATLASDGWDEFEMPMPTEDATPWGLAVALDERSCTWGRFMSGMQYGWHESGYLVELEKKWGIQPTAYLAEQHEKFKDWQTAE